MDHKDAHRWDAKYRAEGRQWCQQRPRQLLLDFATLLPARGFALDAAGGVSVHGHYLAQRGLQVITMDISLVGLRLARERARKARLNMDAVCADLAAPPLAPSCLDLIVNFRFLERSTFAAYRRALKPGGYLIFETFVRQETERKRPDYYLLPGELRAAFADFHIYHYQEIAVVGRSGTPKMAAQLVAAKR